MSEFILDIEQIRKNARAQMQDGAVTANYQCESLVDMIKENLIAERIAVDSNSAAIRFIGTTDPTTRRMLESVLVVEEEHADGLADRLAAFDLSEPIN